MGEEWQEPYLDRADQLAQSLEDFVQTLNEVIVDHLSTALENGHEGRPKLDKDLQTARRAIEKAIHLLER